MSLKNIITFSLFIFTFSFYSFSQTRDTIDSAIPADTSVKIIGNITIIGNKITKDRIITRELTFNTGDTIPFYIFEKRRVRSEENVYNTSLFNSVHITWLKTPQGQTDIYVIVKERWYIFPVPIFELIDRNFNVWWQTKDFSRIVYGGALNWYNFRGRNETVELAARLGYTQSLSFSYAVPYLNKKQKAGLSAGFSYSRNHQTSFETYDNVPVFYKDTNNFSIKAISAALQYSYRQGLYAKHYVSVGYLQADVEDTLIKLNPDFFDHQKNTEKYFYARYFYRYDHRDFVAYPLHGYLYDIEFVQNGISLLKDDVNFFYITSNLRKHWQLARRWYFAASFRGKLSDGNFQPYFNNRALGYGVDYVRGYEYYVIDGQSFALFKTNLKFEILPKKEVHARFIPLEKFATIPFAFYFNIYGDAAYAKETEFYRVNSLTNSWIYGYGAGIDFVTYYDVVLRFEYSINKMMERGFFLHFTAPI